jgi:hypothetical protein
MIDRYNVFSQYDVAMPEFTPAFIAELLRYAMAAVALGAILWLISVLTSKRGAEEAKSAS